MNPRLILPLVCLLLAACASSRPGAHDPAAAAPQPLADIDARRLAIIDGRSGEPLSWAGLVSAAAGADAVLIGELHNQPAGQAFEAALFDDILAGAPAAAGALEFYERDHQVALDDYLTGVSTWADVRRRTGRDKGDDCPGHRAVINACKQRHRPVIAANAPRRYVRLARTDGYDRLGALGPDQRRLFRIPDRLPEPGARYRDDFDRLMGDTHETDPGARPADPAEQARIDAMFRAHSLWDWTMADSLARAIDNPDAPARPAVLIVGKFHTDHRGGLVQALSAIRPGTRYYTVSMEFGEPGPLTDEDRDAADAIVYIGAETEPD